jgi:poly-gamma-glutamate synthesis protein (capsule biosynthesis protein)
LVPSLRSFTIAATGDVLIHEAIATVARPTDGYDFAPLLAPIGRWLEPADLAICHLEGTLSPTNTGLLYQQGDTHPAYFNAPREVADALAATGYDACSTASNHALDRGSDGITETLDVLDGAGIAHAGTARNPAEQGASLYEVTGVVVGHISATFGTNVAGSPDRPWEVDRIDTEALLAEANRAREQGAEFVVLSLHWGTEYRPQPTQYQVDLADALLGSADIDLILGHHAHVVQPIDRIGDEVVVYGMGNHISNIRGRADGSKNGGEDGVIVHITVTEQTDGGFLATEVRFTPTWVDPVTKEVLPVAVALQTDNPNVGALEASWLRTVERISLFGALGVEPTEVP